MHIINNNRKILASLILLVLLFMQLSAVSHANEHLLNTSETKCIIHLEAEQFSNLLSTHNPELSENNQVHYPIIQNKSLSSNHIIISYLSRAPPGL